MKFVALLRGINVGGNNPIKMDALKKSFESMGFTNVKTILASGNVLFDSRKKEPAALGKSIENELEKSFGRRIGVIVRTIERIQALADDDPFKHITVTAQTRLYVTFLAEQLTNPQRKIGTADEHFRIIKIFPGEVCSVLTLSPERNTVDLMNMLEKEFGKQVTTRNWNTIGKILQKQS